MPRIASMNTPTFAAEDMAVNSLSGQRQWVDSGPLKHLEQGSKWKSNDVRVTAVDGVDEHGPDSLYGIRAGLVERFTGFHVPSDLPLAQRQHPHLGFRHARL